MQDAMRKIIVFNRISVDGFFAGANGESHEWFLQDPKVDAAAHKMMNPDSIIFGRVTYEIFNNYWPKVGVDKTAPKMLRDTARELNDMNKFVFSKKLKSVDWENSTLIKGGLEEEVRKLKKGKGGDITIFGSGTIVQQLTKSSLIDEFILVVTPVILGNGKSFFKDVKQLNLELLETKTFDSGNTILHYKTSFL
jgi:dihydrofolate reductase